MQLWKEETEMLYFRKEIHFWGENACLLWKYTPQAKRILGRVDYTQAKLNTNSLEEMSKEHYLSSGGGGC